MSEVAIRIKNLSKVYHLYDKPIDRMKEALSISRKKYGKEHYALHNVSFDIFKGETIGIIGTNGSGKSTLLKVITGVLSATVGSVAVNGKISALLELGAGFNPEYTGLENIYLNGTMMGYSKEEMEIRVPEIISFADIGDFIYQPVKTYSSGMFARLAFAVSINVDPDILIIDEALSVGDVRFQIKCMDKMKEMMENKGTTVILVSHDINAIRRFCKRAIWVDKGEVKLVGKVNEVCDRYTDYLNCGGKIEVEETKVEENDLIENQLPRFEKKVGIAEIVSFSVLDNQKKETDKFQLDEKVTIKVIYDVYDETIEHPVLGVALRKIDNEYICGLNTLLDKVSIPWKEGRNKFYLNYIHGIRATGGQYYFDVALFDKTATVPIDYVAKIKDIIVESDYVGEGRYVIPHKWGMKYE